MAQGVPGRRCLTPRGTDPDSFRTLGRGGEDREDKSQKKTVAERVRGVF